MLDWLQPGQSIYCDKDSVIFVCDKKNPLHRSPSNDADGLPKNVRVGKALGGWEDEFEEGGFIKEIIVGGAKSDSCVTDKGKIVVKHKGMTLDRADSNIITFVFFFKKKKVRDIVLNGGTLESEKRYQFTWNHTTKAVETRYISRTVQSTLDPKKADRSWNL